MACSTSPQSQGPAARVQQALGPLPYLQQCAVPLEHVQYAEYCFRVVVNFNKKLKEDPGVTVLKQILTGLLNTSGGILEVSSHDNLPPSAGIQDKWKSDLQYAFNVFIPVHVQQHCIRMFDSSFPFILCVQKSPQPITLKTHMCIRGMAGNEMLRDIPIIKDVMARSTQTSTPDPFDMISSLKYEDPTTIREGESIELKCWKAVRVFDDAKQKKDTYKNRLQDDRMERTLCSMPNVPGGGYVIIGVEENERTQANIILGQVISEHDEEELKKFLADFLTEDTSHNRRTWGDGNRSPRYGTDWTIRFIPVTGGPPGERRRVIVIHFNHCPGGLWMRYPESYMVSDEGFVHAMSFADWVDALTAFVKKKSNTSLRSYDVTNHGTVYRQKCDPTMPGERPSKTPGTSPNPTFLTPTAHTYDISQDSDSEDSDSSMDNSPELPKKTVAKIESWCYTRKNLSFTEHKQDWHGNLNDTSVNLNHNIGQLAKSRIFDFSNPTNFTPGKDTITSSQPGLEREVNIFIKHIQEPEESFAIASSNWLSSTQYTVTRPTQHLFDVFKVTKSGDVDLWIVVKRLDKTSQNQWKYGVLAGRITKRKCLLGEVSERSSPISSISVNCHIYSLEDGATMSTTSSDLSDWFRLKSDELRGFKLGVAAMFLQGETRIKSIFGDDLSITLTALQMETILDSDLERFVFIEGPPGSGKTYIALYLCQRYENYVYICTTNAFKNFLIHKGLDPNKILVADTQRHIRRKNLHNIDCVVFDDFQNAPFSEKRWKKLFNAVAQTKRARLFVFGDNQYQHFEDATKSTKTVSCMIEYCVRNNLQLAMRRLSEIHRNTRKIASFIQSSFDASQYPEIDGIKCSRAEDGDDVELRYIPDITDTNRLKYFVIDELENPQGTMNNECARYEPSEVAILLDRPESDVVKLRDIFKSPDIYRHKTADVHGADTFPVTGYTIDSLDNFMGMDRKVCIIVTRKQAETSEAQTGRSLANPRYRTFAASRGISRVVFVVESELTPALAGTFGLDNPPDDIKRLWHLEKGVLVLDMCVLDIAGTPAVMYIADPTPLNVRPLAGRDLFTNIRVVGLDGMTIYVSFDSKMKRPESVASSNDSRKLVVIGPERGDKIAPYSWSVYEVQPPKLMRLHTHRLRHTRAVGTPSVRWTASANVLILTDKVLCCLSSSEGQMLWEYTEGVLPGSYMAVRGENIYVNDLPGKRILELTMEGKRSRIFPTRSGITLAGPRGLNVLQYKSGTYLVMGEYPSNKIYALSTQTTNTSFVIEAPGEVQRLCVPTDCHLAVATDEGLAMYDINALILQP